MRASRVGSAAEDSEGGESGRGGGEAGDGGGDRDTVGGWAAEALRVVGSAEAGRMLDALLRSAAVLHAPLEVGRLLAQAGRWRQLLDVLPPPTALRLLYSEAALARALLHARLSAAAA
eukprot:2627569-Prymnesium_polylepis.1